jgi:SIR2-like domain
MIPPNLIDAYKKGSFGVFVGAGISQGSGLPSWQSLLKELIEDCKKNGTISTKKASELLKISKDTSKYLLIAEELREIMGADMQKYIQKRFDEDTLKPSLTLKAIIKLNYKFIITTNYDTLIERAFVEDGVVPNDITYKDAATINNNLLNSKSFLLKAHGDARRSWNEIIITEKDYRNIIYREPGYQSVLQVIFSMFNILFLGVSLNDPELKLLLGYIHNVFHGGSPQHFALMDKTKITPTEIERWRKDFQINIIPYDPKDDHKAVHDLVVELLNS